MIVAEYVTVLRLCWEGAGHVRGDYFDRQDEHRRVCTEVWTVQA